MSIVDKIPPDKYYLLGKVVSSLKIARKRLFMELSGNIRKYLVVLGNNTNVDSTKIFFNSRNFKTLAGN
ncbi:hypothetical protein BH11PAT1_BH11PAT1_4450 [soil metagenome]